MIAALQFGRTVTCGTSSSEWQAHSPPWSALLTGMFLSHLTPAIHALPSVRSLEWDAPFGSCCPQRGYILYARPPFPLRSALLMLSLAINAEHYCISIATFIQAYKSTYKY